MDLEQLRKEHGAKTAVLRGMVSIAEEEKRQFTAQDEARWADLQAEIDDLDKWIKRAAYLQGAEDVAHTPVNSVERPEVGGEVPTAKRFRSFGEQMQAVMKAGMPGGQLDPRLQTRATGMSEGVPSDGGFLVQTDFATELLKRTYETGQVANRCRRISLSSNANAIKIPAIEETSRADGSRWGGIRAYWKAEGAQKTAAEPTFRQISLDLKKLTGLAYATDELLQDAGALESVLAQGYAEEFGFKLDDAIINGTGGGMPLGILVAPCLVSVTKEVGQSADTIVPENLVKMWSRCYAKSRLNAVWFINQDIEPQLFTMGLAVGLGGVSVYMPPGGLSQQPYGTLFGRPVIPIEQAATLGDQGDIILADFSQYVLVDKGGMQSASSIHVKFDYDETVFRFVYRVDGQPIWASALTPYKGTSNTVSPFVTLAARA